MSPFKFEENNSLKQKRSDRSLACIHKTVSQPSLRPNRMYDRQLVFIF